MKSYNTISTSKCLKLLRIYSCRIIGNFIPSIGLTILHCILKRSIYVFRREHSKVKRHCTICTRYSSELLCIFTCLTIDRIIPCIGHTIVNCRLKRSKHRIWMRFLLFILRDNRTNIYPGINTTEKHRIWVILTTYLTNLMDLIIYPFEFTLSCFIAQTIWIDSYRVTYFNRSARIRIVQLLLRRCIMQR